MNGILGFCRRHPLLSAITGGLYFLATVLFHKPVARLSLRIEQQVSYLSYNKGWGLFALIGLSLILLVVVIRIVRGGDRIFELLMLVLTFGLIGTAHWTVLAVNLEYIHVIQFSLLVFPLFALTLRFGETVFWIGLLGAVDELYQYYVVWWPHQSYFDFNDIALDIVGGVFMVFLIYLWVDRDILRAHGRIPRIRWLRSPSLLAAAGLMVATVLAGAAGLLRFHPISADNPGAAPVLLSRDLAAPQFWSVFEKGKTYHIMEVAEWMGFLLLITALYSFLDRRIRSGEHPPPVEPGD